MFFRYLVLVLSIMLCGSVSYAYAAEHGKSHKSDSKRALAEQLTNQLIKDGFASKECIAEAGGPLKAIDIEAVDLNSDGVTDYIIAGNCSCLMGARSSMWLVYAKLGKDYKMILDAGALDGLEPVSDKTNHYKNLKGFAYTKGGAEKDYVVYKYYGNKYKSQ